MKTAFSPVCFMMIVITGATARADFVSVDPDGFAHKADISHAFAGVTLSVVSLTEAVPDSRVFALDPTNDLLASTGDRNFGWVRRSGTSFSDYWTTTDASEDPANLLRADFDAPVDAVSIDVIGNNHSDFGFLEAFDSSNTSLGRVESGQLTFVGDFETLTVWANDSISYIIAGGIDDQTVRLDHLQYIPAPGSAALVVIGFSMLGARRKSSRSR